MQIFQLNLVHLWKNILALSVESFIEKCCAISELFNFR